ncbi:unnamed protein product [Urochloa decumbens]|uniref:Thaumatin-like protein n=1 Tax=Urochloa decumbens TaxID=240449 RepID=A0ABC8YHI6_9POAL
MASSAAGSKPAFFLLLVVVVALTPGAGVASAASFIVANLCPFPVWPAAIPTGGGTQLNPGQGWLFTVPAGTTGGRIWGRTDCHFTAGDHGRCATGDCAGALHCELSGKPAATLAEFTLGGGGAEDDFYDISVADGFNLPMSFVCDDRSGRDATPIRCMDPDCAGEVRTCKADRVYHYHSTTSTSSSSAQMHE